MTARRLIELIGPARLRLRLQVSDRQISKCRVEGSFPARWLPGTRDLALEAGLAWDPAWDYQLFAVLELAPPATGQGEEVAA